MEVEGKWREDGSSLRSCSATHSLQLIWKKISDRTACLCKNLQNRLTLPLFQLPWSSDWHQSSVWWTVRHWGHAATILNNTETSDCNSGQSSRLILVHSHNFDDKLQIMTMELMILNDIMKSHTKSKWCHHQWIHAFHSCKCRWCSSLHIDMCVCKSVCVCVHLHARACLMSQPYPVLVWEQNNRMFVCVCARACVYVCVWLST